MKKMARTAKQIAKEEFASLQRDIRERRKELGSLDLQVHALEVMRDRTVNNIRVSLDYILMQIVKIKKRK